MRDHSGYSKTKMLVQDKPHRQRSKGTGKGEWMSMQGIYGKWGPDEKAKRAMRMKASRYKTKNNMSYSLFLRAGKGRLRAREECMNGGQRGTNLWSTTRFNTTSKTKKTKQLFSHFCTQCPCPCYACSILSYPTPFVCMVLNLLNYYLHLFIYFLLWMLKST